MLKTHRLTLAFIAWFILYSLLHLPAFRVDLQHIHVFRQAMTQVNIRNFAREDFNILNPRHDNRGTGDGIFRLEFPVMQWLFGGVYRVAGTDDIRITRLLTLLLGILSTVGIYRFLNALFHNQTLAGIGAWLFSFSPTFYYFTVCPLPDNFALCSAIWALVAFLAWVRSRRTVLLITAGFLFALASAAKLPFVLYGAFPAGWFLIEYLRDRQQLPLLIKSAAVLFSWQILPVLWYATVIPTWGGNPVVGGWFSAEGDLLRGLDYLQHHLISTLPENLINFGALPVFLYGLYLVLRKRLFRRTESWPLLAWFGLHALYYGYELPVIGKSHDYYFMPVLPMIAVVSGLGLKHLLSIRKSWSRVLLYAVVLAVPVFAYFRINNRWFDRPEDTLQVYKTELRAALPPGASIVTGNDNSGAVNHYFLDRRGWSFAYDNLTAEQLREFIRQGAGYLVSSSRAVEEQPEIRALLGLEVYAAGEYRVFELVQE
ncbi:MAG: glycosyltransferase family 39 protein [Saprospiraceae bacterium]